MDTICNLEPVIYNLPCDFSVFSVTINQPGQTEALRLSTWEQFSAYVTHNIKIGHMFT